MIKMSDGNFKKMRSEHSEQSAVIKQIVQKHLIAKGRILYEAFFFHCYKYLKLHAQFHYLMIVCCDEQ